jgi:hypothetical protein
VRLQTPSKQSLKGKKRAPSHDSEGGVSQKLEYTTVQPSPRRLRSKDREHAKCIMTDDPHATPVANSKRRSNARKSNSYDREDIEPRLLRVTPMRKAKDIIGDLVESDGDEGEEGDDSPEDGEPVVDEEDEEADEDQFDEPQEEDEIDELVSSASVSPPESQSLHIPTKRRSLRPRRKHVKIVPTGDEGDDEEEEEEQSDGGEGEEEDVEEATLAVEPRKLRSGKIVSDVEEVMEVDSETIGSGDEEGNEGEELDDTESVGGSEISMDHDDDIEEQEELMEEDGEDCS